MSSAELDAEPLACPRCHSRETKFCYYNNYSTAQPRHFCKNCKRYWTAGGSLRNVPVGGGLRKTKKSKLSKHVKDLLSASPEEYYNSGKPATSLPLPSPSSSVDGVVDEAFTNPVVPLLAYRPSFDFATESLNMPGDCNSLPTSHTFDYSNLTQNSEDHANAFLPAKGPYQHVCDVHSFQQPQDWYGSVDQAHGNYGEISSEPSQEGLSNMQSRYPSLQRHPQHHKVPTGLRGSYEESRIFSQQGKVQCFVEDHTSSQDSILKNTSSTEDEDEGLGNVINVRYPYDWEQVSEVLFGGTPDFFHMPTF